jgi:hypothetical protein
VPRHDQGNLHTWGSRCFFHLSCEQGSASLSSHSLRFSTIIFNNTAADQNILSMAAAGIVPERLTDVFTSYFNTLYSLLEDRLKKHGRKTWFRCA